MFRTSRTFPRRARRNSVAPPRENLTSRGPRRTDEISLVRTTGIPRGRARPSLKGGFGISRDSKMDDETLNRLAVEALLEEAKIGARRAEIMGPTGWIKPKESVNKRFLHSTLRNVVLSNKHRSAKKDKSADKQSCKADSAKKL